MNELSSTYIYHVNSLKNIETVVHSFDVHRPQLYVAKEDGFWAGNGMYFWDNIGNANYWLRMSRKSNPVILKAKLTYASLNMFDLTDSETLSTLNELWPLAAKKYNVKSNVSLGKKINTISEFFNGNLKVVRELGYYPAKKEHAFVRQDIDMQKPHVTTNAKIIYCIKDYTVLSDLKVLRS